MSVRVDLEELERHAGQHMRGEICRCDDGTERLLEPNEALALVARIRELERALEDAPAADYDSLDRERRELLDKGAVL